MQSWIISVLFYLYILGSFKTLLLMYLLPAILVVSVTMLRELQESCESSVQILDDVLIFDGLRDNQDAKQRSIIGVNRLFRRLVTELEPLVGMD